MKVTFLCLSFAFFSPTLKGMCIQTALTGHKVLTTFHTEDSIGALVRLLDMDIEPFLVSSTVGCIVAQRLVRRLCPHCSVPCPPEVSQLRRLGCTHADLAGGDFCKGREEGVSVNFQNEAVKEIARVAHLMNEETENIGARRI